IRLFGERDSRFLTVDSPILFRLPGISLFQLQRTCALMRQATEMKIACSLLTLVCAMAGVTHSFAQNRVLELDGNESWIELPADLLKDVKTELTVEGWIRWERLGTWSRFFDFGLEGRGLYLCEFLDSANLNTVIHTAQAAQELRIVGVLRTN